MTGGFQAGTRAAAGNRLPTAPRERKPALAALAVLLILAGALTTVLLVTRSGNRIDVVMMKNDVPAGTAVTTNDIEDVQVAANSGIDYVEWTQVSGVVGHVFPFALISHTLLVGEMYHTSASDLPKPGQVAITLVLKPGQYTDKMVYPGNTVSLYLNGSSGSGTSGQGSAVTPTAPVSALVLAVSGTDTIDVTLSIPTDQVAPVTAASGSLILAVPGS
jgi:hypothetical protein